MQSQNVAAIVLAAGKGTRMKSDLPKVLHKICGISMLGHVIRTLNDAGIDEKCIVVGGDVDRLKSALSEYSGLSFALQKDRLGTGEAVACAGFSFQGITPPKFASGGHLDGPKLNSTYVLICAGDTPAMDSKVIQSFIQSCLQQNSQLAVLGMKHPEPKGYGRLITDEKLGLVRIVEEKDASEAERKVQLCNSGVIFARTEHLFSLLKELKQENAQKEYYLTDCFAISHQQGVPAQVWATEDFGSFDGVNDRVQLARLEARMLEKIRTKWMVEGVGFQLASSCYIETSVQIGSDTTIGPHVSLMGQTSVGKGCEIGSHSVLKNVNIPDGAVVPAGTIRIES